MGDSLLAARLVRGAGARDLLLLAGVVAGLALTVCCLLLAVAMPAVMSMQQSTAAARTDVAGDATPGRGARLSTSIELLDDRPYRRVAVRGAAPRTPTPPGVASWPAPGHSLVSPALRARLDADPSLGRRLALGVIDDDIGDSGLTAPDELYSYTVLDALALPYGATSFGTGGYQRLETPAAMIFVELAALVGLPGMLFLTLCLRATARSRQARYRRLVVLGVTARRCARLYATEVTLCSVLGCTLGVLAYYVLQGPIGAYGVLGASWWPADGRLGRGAVLVIVPICTIVVLVVRSAARWAMTATLRAAPRRAGRQRSGRVETVVLTITGALTLVALGDLTAGIARSAPGVVHRIGSPEYTHALWAVGVLAVCAPLAVGPLARRAATGIERHLTGAPAHAARIVVARWSSIGRLVPLTTCLVLVCGLAHAFTVWVHVTTSAPGTLMPITVQIPESGPASAPHGAASELRATLSQVTGHITVLDLGSPDGVGLTAVACPPGAALDCPVADRRGTAIAASHRFNIALDDGSTRVVPATGLPVQPRTSGRGPDAGTAVLDLTHRPWLWTATGTHFVTFLVPPGGHEYADTLTAVHQRAPGATVTAWGGLTSDELAAEQRMILGTGTAGAVLLFLGAFLLVMTQARSEGRRSSNALVAAGVPQRFLRSSYAMTVGLPLGVGALLGAVVSLAACWGMLSLFGREQVTADALRWTALPAVLAPFVAHLWGWTIGGQTFDRRLLGD